MNTYAGNGVSSELAMFETPFADVPSVRETVAPKQLSDATYDNFLKEVDSPFSRTYETSGRSSAPSQVAEEFVQFMAELHDDEFSEAVYEMASEIESRWTGKISNEAAMGDNFAPFATQHSREYFLPLINETEKMIDQVGKHFSGNNLADHTEKEIESFFGNFEFNHGSFTPAQEQFFDKIFDKVKSVVKTGVNLAKKGISAVGKLMPINDVLAKLKGLIKPLLDKVLKFAIGKLPKNLQAHAHNLAKKFLNLETGVSESTDSNIHSSGELDGIQTELDGHIAQLLFTSNEAEGENLVMEYESSTDTLTRANAYENGGITVPSLASARQQFINELKGLQPGESAAPAIERFLPAAILALQPIIKIAITLIGRQKVINFLAGLLAKLVGKYVPEDVAQPLAASIIDVGMGAIGFETYEMNKNDVAYEAIVNTIQETIQHMGAIKESDLNDNESMALHLLEAFETAAANNFPPQYIKPELRKSIQPGVWVLKPRNGPKHLYKKFTRVFSVSLDPQVTQAVTTRRGLPLANFLRDKLGLDPSKPIQAKVHLYETIEGTRLNHISKYENLPGFNASQPFAWVQLHPLTQQAAALLLKEPSLGKDQDAKYTSRIHRTAIGQRFYFLEISGARLRIPPVDHSNHRHPHDDKPGTPKPSQSSDIQGVINFVKSEIRMNYYFSEEDAKGVVEKLNRNDALGAAAAIRHSIRNVLHSVLLKNVGNKVKIIHEAVPEMYLDNIPDREGESPFAALAKTVGGLALGGGKEVMSKIIEKLIDKLAELAYEAVVNFFKARAAEFKEAQAQPQDGVTVKIIWINIPGMSTIRGVINAIRGKLTIGNLADLVLPNIPNPDIKIIADKQFD